ncbi:MAG TPA: type II secretion system F family protein [Noviherbaspirillum sp.]|uniref:type II secretion system F family protein n=1 Tax=Noviherbaspirillum sp. TaxID=1926288 RepID=UPI002F925F0A
MDFDANRLWARAHFGDGVRLRLYRKIAKMLANGLPLLKILDELGKRASRNGEKPGEPLAIILDDCRRSVQNGRLLSEGLEGWVPRSEQMIIMAGEQSGRLEATLLAVTEVVAASKKIRAVVVAGITYPTLILVMVFVYVYLFGTRVIPQFTRIVDPAQWRGAARSLYLMSELVQDWMLILVAALTFMVLAIIASMPRWRGGARVVADRYAPYSIYRLISGTSFLMAFSALQSAGITVERSLVRLSMLASPWMRERLDGALLGVRSGLNCGEALRNAGYGFPSPEVVDDLCVYAEYRGFAEALKLLADEWMEEGIEQVSAQMKVLNAFAIILLAVVIGWLVIGFFGIQQELASVARGGR